jgi:hypothetical protein
MVPDIKRDGVLTCERHSKYAPTFHVLHLACPSVCHSVWHNSVLVGRILMKTGKTNICTKICRKYCDMMSESRNSEVRIDVHGKHIPAATNNTQARIE